MKTSRLILASTLCILAAGCGTESEFADTEAAEPALQTTDDLQVQLVDKFLVKICKPNLIVSVTLQDSGGTAVSACNHNATQVAIVVKNAGICGATASKLRVQGYPWGDISVGSLAAGATATVRLSYVVPAGEYSRTVTADATNLVSETNESDNHAVWACIL